ncbi:prepilin-type N-terminal cleavage/methylation domain-containing protein [Laspinema olomoucense]|uniref:prepilin-type N-terminal cleavage/methylation domain-containing protein n=1 Tax=Laspinema olomoucense TaxID=3231600 RepID=UPI0021BABEDB|nr:prepilin-type N-terminal cleavage/methylation domain-containing protein [Laspinema sp. D3a]MCT7988541.1 prepilin-type N-terminal cleavage/methylation domain-containing protein [Laspinema sp. D3a]
MGRKNRELIFKTYIAHLRQKQTAGFTLLELLMAIVVGSIVMYAMMTLVLSLLGTEKQETAKSQIQQEMGLAMDYIASEMQEAVYIYPGNCLDGVDGGTDGCTDLRTQINFPQEIHPILAFWKLEPIPYTEDDNLPEDCTALPTAQAGDCRDLKTRGHTYTLVVYSLRVNLAQLGQNPINQAGVVWQGPAQITRYRLRKYDPLASLTPTPGFEQDPNPSNFGEWPSGGIQTIPLDHPVLVDSVDNQNQPELEDCPDDYTRSAVSGNNISSFYACVRNPGRGTMQDAIVFLRGNAIARAGQPPASRNPTYLPSLQRQVQARSVFQREPPTLD